ncbi:MAG: HDOD domain-containing protein [Treponema sp.]|nr:HDOD domain-containing protein [Treponema sp.]
MEKNVNIDSEKIKTAIRTGIPISIKTYTLPHDMEVYMGEILSLFLTELNQPHMIQYLTYSLNELVVNAKKANTKRIYFQEKNLDIFNLDDYNIGMKTFKNDTLNNIKYYLQKQKDAGLYVKLILQIQNNTIKIEVKNNSKITPFELERINQKLAQAKQFDSIQDALTTVLDDSEGAGLGLVILILMLEKIGMSKENFQTITNDSETITRITLPLSEETQKEIDTISEEFSNAIQDLPQFPQNIEKLNKLLDSDDSKISDIANQISNDVALTGELLKTVNSAAFALQTPCSSISDAVKMIGTRGIKNMLYSIGSLNIFAAQTKKNEDLWKHSYQVAFYSYNLAKNFCKSDNSVVEDSFVCGLLHDMGKVIFETNCPEYIENVKKICKDKITSLDLFEKIISGVNHGEIGAKIAEKWNFPESIINVIRFHHSPGNAPEATKTLTTIIYIADLMVHYHNSDIQYSQIDKNILKQFNITCESQFQQIAEKLKNVFENSY